MFSKDVYVRRRRTLAEKMKGESGVLLFIGNVESPAQYRDNCYKWRQDGNWLYFFGLEEPAFAAVIDLDNGSETIYADDYSVDDIIWTGPMPTVASLAEKVGVAHSAPSAQLDRDIAEAMANGRKVHFLAVSRYYNALRLSQLTGIDPMAAFSCGKKGSPVASEALTRAVIEMRLVKEDIEIEHIDAACDLGYAMHTAARRGIRLGRIEQEIVGEMEGVTLSGGFGPSFQTILTQHGEIFHCHSHECLIDPDRLMVIDAGAETNSHYASDFTRTYPTSGRFTPRQLDIYQIVYECNELAYNMIAPGIPYRDCHLAANRHMLERLSELKLVHGDIDDMMQLGIAGLFMPHGLGHNMGIECHDMEDLGENLVGYDPDQQRSDQLGHCSLRMARRLRPGNVITDEPGIYFIPALIEQWKREGTDRGHVNYEKLAREYYDFGGIRLEDDILVTSDGARRLGAKRLPIAPDEVEAAMAEDKALFEASR